MRTLSLMMMMMMMLAAVVSVSAAPAEGRNWVEDLRALLNTTTIKTSLQSGSAGSCAKYNPQDCRDFDLVRYQSSEIADHMYYANSSNMNPDFAKTLHGIFYMAGNPNPVELLSAANSLYNQDVSWSFFFVAMSVPDAQNPPQTLEHQEDAIFVRTYDAGVWSYDDTADARGLWNAARTFGSTYRVRKQGGGIFDIDMIYYPPSNLLGMAIPASSAFYNFTLIPTDDPDLFIRRNKFVSISVMDYQLIRIVRGDGSKTPYFYSMYLPRINAGRASYRKGFSNNTHVGLTQLISRVIN